MLLSRRNQLLLEFSFWNEPVPRPGPNIYELRSYQLRVFLHLCSSLPVVHTCFQHNTEITPLLPQILSARDNDRVGKLLVKSNLYTFLLSKYQKCFGSIFKFDP